MPYKPYQQTALAAKPNATVASEASAAMAANSEASAAWNQNQIGPTHPPCAPATAEENNQGDDGKKTGYFKKKFGGIDKSRLKTVSNAVKKKRANFRLRKLVLPKNPCVLLYEMTGAVNYTYQDNPPMGSTVKLFTAECEVDGNKFSGTGPSKLIARNICAENAIQYIVVKKNAEQKNKIASMQPEELSSIKPNRMEDETPWTQLSSLALFKMFTDWQNQGFHVPQEFFNQSSYAPGSEASGDTFQQTIPVPQVTKFNKKALALDNPTEKHPVQLLNELRGQIQFALEETRGMAPNSVFIMSVEIDGRKFLGEGKNKKEAKKSCAQKVLGELHNIIY